MLVLLSPATGYSFFSVYMSHLPVTDQGPVHPSTVQTPFDSDGQFMYFYQLDSLGNMIIVDADDISTIAYSDHN